MLWGLDFWVGAIIGALLGVIAERVFGTPIDALIRGRKTHLISKKSEHLMKLVGANKKLLHVGDELVYVRSFCPAGFQFNSRITAEDRPWYLKIKDVPEHFRSFVPTDGESLERDIEAEREAIASDPGRWNERKLGVDAVWDSRDPQTGRAILDIGFTPSDFASSNVIGDWWQKNVSTEMLDALDDNDLSRVISGMSHNFGLNATVRTSDNKLLLVERSGRISSGRKKLHISVNEGMQASDIDANNRPDLIGTLIRGTQEELGIKVLAQDITLHSLILDASRYQWAVLGHIDLRERGVLASDVIEARMASAAEDWWENSKIFPIDCVPNVILEKLKNPAAWIAHGWVNLILSSAIMFPDHQSDFLSLLFSESPRESHNCR